jgi:hypothetical protein
MTVSTHAMLMVIGIQIDNTLRVANSDLGQRGLENRSTVHILPVCIFSLNKRDVDKPPLSDPQLEYKFI